MENTPSILKSLFEVIITVFFTFIPFVFLSINWAASAGGNTSASLLTKFSGFWESGEIVLPVFGLCGAVAALLALNKGYFPWWVHALVGILVLVSSIGGGAALVGSDGFNTILSKELVIIGFWGYSILAFTWFLLVAKVRLTDPKLRDSGASAQSILDEAERRRSAAREVR